MKVCTKCREEKPLNQFAARPGGRRQSWCRACHTAYNKQFYFENSAVEKQRVYATRAKNRSAAQTLVSQMKAAPCMDCGGRFPECAMDFDHKPGSVKYNTVSDMTYKGYTLDSLKRELDKCELVCANCHRIRTAKRKRNKI